jgi:hypothetical protein
MDDTAVGSTPPVSNDAELDDMFTSPQDIVTSGDEPAKVRGKFGGRLAMVGLVAAGAAVGAVIVTQMNNSSPTTTANTAPAVAQVPGTTGQAPGTTGQAPGNGRGPGGFGGGLAGEQRLSGTVTSVGSSTVTVKTSNGTATYIVNSSTQIIRNGQAVSLSAIKAGDPVFMHVYPSNGKTAVERLFAGMSATQGQNGPGGPPPGAPAQGQTGTTSNT